MIFNSLTFLVFLTLFLGVYIFLKGRARLYFLLASSYVFYGWWDYRYLGLIILSTVIDYFLGIVIDSEDDRAQRKWYLVGSVAVNLTILFTFKYFNFFA